MSRIIRISAGVLSAINLFFIYRFPDIALFLREEGIIKEEFPIYSFVPLIVLLWLGGIFLAYLYLYRDRENKWADLPCILTTGIALVALLGLAEWEPLIYFLILLGGFVISFLFQKDAQSTDTSLSFKKKPLRRMIMMLWVFDTYALVTALFAVAIFFTFIPFWVIVLLSGMLFMYTSFMIWRLYFFLPLRSFLLWLLLIGLIVSELVWTIELLPFGYAVSGFVVTWFWYLLQLFIRFHFGQQGILWKQQRWFLLTNILLMIVFFIFIFRWI
jgi:hypothetical protein